MEPFTKHTGIAAPLDRANIDTDAIIPKQFLRLIKRTGFGKHLFHELRYLDYEGTKDNPDFVLNKPEYKNSTVLLARDNFGCGSSREHAPWALYDYGFRVIIAPSFADIFYNNCIKNDILLVRLKEEEINSIFNEINAIVGSTINADLESQTITTSGQNTFSFDIHPFAKDCLLKGLDHIGWTLQFNDKINAYEEKIKKEQPWVT
ncbi:MAG: 3-isopropylmalate dehydratase small subunit [Candidatus Omnitrophica bacterium]|nr:3-isopropylmalate dehydratase small subunit [Candidatus Omnitrophota bacterium]MBU1996092.1 3-isopropylmalate dehydratase small subunit [Candidatus Omnitrophota bacterium]MBU4334857.1 3-isopropylmalate dehydratase small subunit [Candidatus Omnitrophota bacterium]